MNDDTEHTEHAREVNLTDLWEAAPKLVAKGWHPVPIEPNSKACRVKNWTRWCEEAPSAEDLTAWASRDPQPSIGLTLGRDLGDGSHLVALDWDLAPEHEPRAAAVEAALGIGSAPAKRGARGWTCFVRLLGGDGRTANCSLLGAVAMVGADGHEHSQAVQVLAAGAQGVIPPSPHPDTKTPYVWLPGRSLWPKGDDGRPTIRSVDSLPVIALADLVEALESEGFDTGNLRRRDPAVVQSAVPAVVEGLDAAEPEGDDLTALLDDLEFRSDTLGKLWRGGPAADIAHLRDRSGSGVRHQMCFHMNRAGYTFGQCIAALRQWPHTVGGKPFSIDDDLARPTSRLVASWTTAARRLEAAEAENAPTEGFATAVEGDEAESGPAADAGRRAKRGIVRGVLPLSALVARGRKKAPLRLVEGLVGHGTYVDCFGSYGSGKSLFAAVTVVGIASGGTVGGRACDRGAVLVLGYEDGEGLAATVMALAGDDLGRLPIAFVLEGDGLRLPSLNTDGDKAVAAVVGYCNATRERFGLPVRLVLVDTKGKAAVGLKLNDDDAASVVIGRFYEIAALTGATVWVNSHPPKNGSGETTAGSHRWGSDADTIFNVVKRDDGSREVVTLKSKGGAFGATATFTLEVVPAVLPVIGDDGEPLPRDEWGTTAIPHFTRDFRLDEIGGGAARRKPLDPTTIAGEALHVLRSVGPMKIDELLSAMQDARRARGLEVIDDPKALRSELRKLDASLRKPNAARWIANVEGLWCPSDAAPYVGSDLSEEASEG